MDRPPGHCQGWRLNATAFGIGESSDGYEHPIPTEWFTPHWMTQLPSSIRGAWNRLFNRKSSPCLRKIF